MPDTAKVRPSKMEATAVWLSACCFLPSSSSSSASAWALRFFLSFILAAAVRAGAGSGWGSSGVQRRMQVVWR